MKSIFAASMVVSFALVLSRVSGFLREVLLAARLGSSETADAAILMLTLPDFMVALLLTGGLNAALVPALKGLNGPQRQAFLLRVSVTVGLVFACVALLFVVFVPALVGLLAPELDIYAMPDFRTAFGVSMMALPVAALIGVTASYLNTTGKFATPGIGVLLFNVLLSAYIANALPNGGYLKGLAVMIICAAFVRLGLHLCAMKDLLRVKMSDLKIWSENVSADFGWRFVQGIGAFSIIVGVSFIFRSLHAGLGDGYLTLFNYAQKLYELPAALMIAPVVVVLLPKLSAMVASGDTQFHEHVAKGLMAVLALAGIALGVGYIFMEVIVQIVFGYGVITEKNQWEIVETARIMLFALPFYAVSQITGIALNAQKRTRLFFVLSLVSLAASVLIYVGLLYFAPPQVQAPVAFVSFSLVLAASSYGTVFPPPRWNTGAILGLFFLVVRLLICLVPVGLLMGLYRPDALLLEVALMIVATIFCLALVLSTLKPLLQMRIDAT